MSGATARNVVFAQNRIWDVNTLAWIAWDGSLTTGSVTIGTVNQGAGGVSAWKVDGSAVTQPVSGTVTAVTVPVAPGSVSQASVNDTNASGTLLASNSNRIGATIYNDSDQYLFLKLGGTASTSSFTCRVVSHGYYEVPFRYTGVIDGIWAANSTGAARITELSL